MAHRIPALVKSELLIWARKSAGYALEQAAKQTGFDEMLLEEWEQGHEVPSMAELRQLGEA